MRCTHPYFACLTVGFTLLGVLLSSTGVSVSFVFASVQTSTTQSSEWFPCKGHGCGCDSAEMCRTNCCCFPKAQTPSQPSCCSGKTKSTNETESDASKSQGLVVMRSRECSGMPTGALLFTIGQWQAEPAANDNMIPDLPAQLINLSTDAPITSASLLIDPPPPRRLF